MWCWCAEGLSDILLPRLWSGLAARTRLVENQGTIGLSLINNWSVGLIKGFVTCVCCVAVVIFLRDVDEEEPL